MVTPVDNNLENLKNLWIELFLDKTNKVSNVADGSVLNATAFGTAKVAQKAIKDIAIVEAKLFPDTAVGEYLDKCAALYGVSPRKSALGSSTYVRVYAKPGTVYDESVTFVNKNGIRFSVDVPLTVGSSGYGYVSVRSVNAGFATNVAPNSIVTASPQPVGHIECTNEYYAIGGRDSEDDEVFRIRIKNNNNKFSQGTIEYWTQILQELDPRVLKVLNVGLGENGVYEIYIVSQNGISFTTAELDTLLEQAKGNFSIFEMNLEGDVMGIVFKNAEWFYVGSDRGLDFRIDIKPEYTATDVRRNIQVALTKYLDFRFWKAGSIVQWDDLLDIVKKAEGVKFVPDEFFFPWYDEVVPINQLPRIRGFVMRDLDGNILFDAGSSLSPLFYPAETEDIFRGLTDSSLSLSQPAYFNVVDEQGDPIPNARITVGANSVLTDANGQATLSLINGNYNYSITKQKYETLKGSFVILNNSVTIGVTLVLAPYTVSFVVIDENGAPLPSADIAIDNKKITTNALGEASIDVKNGTYLYTVTKLGYEQISGKSVTVNDSNIVVNETMYFYAWETTIVVQNDRSSLLSGVVVEIGGNSYLTDDEGKVVLQIVNGTYKMTLKKLGYEQKVVNIEVQDRNETFIYQLTPFEYNISIKVFNPDGVNVVSGALVSLNNGLITGVTDAEGAVEFKLINGSYSYSITKREFNNIEGNFNVQNSDLSFEFTAQWRSFTGTIIVVDQNQSPVEGAAVNINNKIYISDEAGQVVVPLSNGSYTYTVTKLGFYDYEDVIRVFDNDASEVISLTPRLYDVTFTVNDGENPIEGASILIYGRNLTTDVNGQVTTQLINGTYQFTISKLGYNDLEGSATVANQNLMKNVTMTLKPWNIQFYLTDRGTAVPNATISIGDKTITTNEGGIANTTLVNGTYLYTISKQGYVNEQGTLVVENSDVSKSVTINPIAYDVEFLVTENRVDKVYSNGVYIQDVDSKLYTQEEWSALETKPETNGVAVIKDKYSFVIAKEDVVNLAWGGYGTQINNIMTTSSVSLAQTDFLGQQNTEKIIAQLGAGNAPAAEYCASYIFPNGQPGYLPAVGELQIVYENMTDINACMALISGATVNQKYWASTQYNADNAWYFTIHLQNILDARKSQTSNRTRAFSSLIIVQNIVPIEGVEISINNEVLTTNAEGKANLNIYAGIYSTVYSKTGYQRLVKDVTISGVQIVEDSLKKIYNLDFIVVTAAREPIAGATVKVSGEAIVDGPLTLETDSQGKTNQIAVVNGNYNYNAYITGYSPEIGTGAIADSDQEKTVDLVFGLETTFSVTDGTDPIASATIVVDGAETKQTGSDGLALFNLSNGTHLYSISKQGYILKNGSVVVNDEVQTIDIALVAGGEVTFTITDNNIPVEGVDVNVVLVEISSTSFSGKTNNNGVWKVGLASGDWRYNLNKEGYKTVSDVDFTVETVDKAIAFDLKDYYYWTAEFDFSETSPIGATIKLYKDSASGTLIETKVGESRTVIFENLVNGTYYYEITKDRFKTVTGTFVINNAKDVTTVNLVPVSTVTFTVTNDESEKMQNVSILFNEVTVVTDVNGAATFPNIEEGTYEYVATPPSPYEPKSGSVVVGIEDVNVTILFEDLVDLSFTVKELGKLPNGAYIQTVDGKVYTKDEYLQQIKRYELPGVYIQDVDRKLYTQEEWTALTTKPTSNGVAVISDKCSFIIAKTQDVSGLRWSTENDVIIKVLTTTEESTAVLDFAGYRETRQIVDQSVSAPAAMYCDTYLFPNNDKGYMPALGEWKVAYENKTDINACMTLIGGDVLGGTSAFWSTTQATNRTAWAVNLDSGTFNKRQKGAGGVRAFAKIPAMAKPNGVYIQDVDGKLMSYTDYLGSYTSGVYIQDIEGNLYTKAEWVTLSKKYPNGIYFCDTNDKLYTEAEWIAATPKKYQDGVYICDTTGKLYTQAEWEAAHVKKYPDGTYICDTEGKLYTKDEWEIVSKTYPNGVYIQDIDSKLYTQDEWNALSSKPETNGVAVIKDDHSFVIAKEDSRFLIWGVRILINGLIEATDISLAQSDFSGQQNTEKIIAQLGAGNAPAAEYCNSYIFPNGQPGYLGAAGEWKVAYDNKAEVDVCMSLIGGTAINTSYYWTSTQYSVNSSWSFRWFNGDVSSVNKSAQYYVRAFNIRNNPPVANGVTVISGDHAFTIAKEVPSSNLIWSNNSTIVSDVMVAQDYIEAQSDFLGQQNTEKIIAQLGAGNAPAAEYCASYIFPNGQPGYLGSAGEWYLAFGNKADVDNFMNFIGGSAFIEVGVYLSSTQYYITNRVMTVAWGASNIANCLSNVTKNADPNINNTKARAFQSFNNYEGDESTIPVANGVTVISGNRAFTIAKEDSPNALIWGGSGTQVKGIMNTSDTTTAKTDFSGRSNTEKIIAQIGAISVPAAEYCNSYIFPNGQTGYLGALGEWQVAYNNKAEIDTYISLIGGAAMNIVNYYWTSTQASSSSSWRYYWSNGDPGSADKNGTRFARSFQSYNNIQDGSPRVKGITIISDEASFTVSLYNNISTRRWGPTNLQVGDIVTTTTSSIAITDFKGAFNTEKIIAAYGVSDPNYAAYAVGINSADGYLGALGEMKTVMNNLVTVKNYLNVVNGDQFSTNTNYWTSTQYSTDQAWSISTMITAYGNVKTTYMGLVRALFPFNNTSDSLPIPNGVVVINGGIRFVISKDTSEETKAWGANASTSILVRNIITTESANNEAAPYGYIDTFQIINQLTYQLGPGNAPAAEYCNSYIFPNGQPGYLPSMTEMVITFGEKDRVDELMTLIGGATLNSDNHISFWTSSQYNDTQAWFYNSSSKNFTNWGKEGLAWVRAFQTFNPKGMNNPNAIAVINPKASFKIALTVDPTSPGTYGGVNQGAIPGLKLYSSSNDASTDFDGASNTSAIAGFFNFDSAAESCMYFTFPDGERGLSYLPSFGELSLCFSSDLLEIIEAGLVLTGGLSLESSSTSSSNFTWTSTQNSSTTVWIIKNSTTSSTNVRGNTNKIRPFGQLIDIDQNKLPNGVAVVSDDASFVMADESKNSSTWGGGSMLIPDIVTTEDTNVAKTDFKGEFNTDKITEILSRDGTPAAWACWDYIFPNGQRGYLGAAGEWNIIKANETAVAACNSLIGQTPVFTTGYGNWSSTQYNNTQAWSSSFSGLIVSGTKNGNDMTRPLTSFDPYIIYVPSEGTTITTHKVGVSTPTHEGTTDSEGKATLRASKGFAYDYEAEKTGFLSVTGTTKVLTENTEVPEIRLLKPITVSFRVTENTENGAPIVGCEVKLSNSEYPDGISKLTDENGNVIIFIPPGYSWLVTLSKEGYKTAEAQLPVLNDFFEAAPFLEKYYTITFLVMRKSQVLSGVSVDFNRQTVTTNSHGEAIFENVLYTPSSVFIVNSGEFYKEYTNQIAVDSDRLVNVSVVPLYKIKFITGQEGATITSTVWNSLTTGADGTATSPTMEAGSVLYSVSKTGFESVSNLYSVESTTATIYEVQAILVRTPKLVTFTSVGTHSLDTSYKYASLLAFGKGGDGGDGGAGALNNEGGGGGGASGTIIYIKNVMNYGSSIGLSLSGDTLKLAFKFLSEPINVPKGVNGSSGISVIGGKGAVGDGVLCVESSSANQWTISQSFNGGQGGGAGTSDGYIPPTFPTSGGGGSGSSGAGGDGAERPDTTVGSGGSGGDGSYGYNGGNGGDTNRNNGGAGGAATRKYDGTIPLTTVFNGTGNGGQGGQGNPVYNETVGGAGGAGGAGGYGNGGNGGQGGPTSSPYAGGYGAGGGGCGATTGSNKSGGAGGEWIVCVYYHDNPLT